MKKNIVNGSSIMSCEDVEGLTIYFTLNFPHVLIFLVNS
jgi:hypothetical protein